MFLLDLDGPILNVKEKYFWVYRTTVDSLGLGPTLACEEFWNLKREGAPMEVILSPCATEGFVGFQREWKKRIEGLEALAKDSLTTNICDTLAYLKTQDDIVLVTLRHHRDTLMQQLHNFGLLRYFTQILSPEPKHFAAIPDRSENWRIKVALVEENLKLSGQQTNYFIGDMATDILAGKALGTKTIGVTSGMRSHLHLAKLDPDFLLTDLCELPAILSKVAEPAPFFQEI